MQAGKRPGDAEEEIRDLGPVGCKKDRPWKSGDEQDAFPHRFIQGAFLAGGAIGFAKDHVGLCRRCGREASGLEYDSGHFDDRGEYLCPRCGDEPDEEEDEEDYFD